jgi:surface carbohydrate biosynthesis protein
MKKPIVYLPIEYASRELDSKMLLACRLIAQGLSVVIGQQWLLYANFDRLPAGVVVFKSSNMIHHPAMKRARAAGHFVISFEEESLAHSKADMLDNFFNPSLFASADAIFCAGTLEAETIRKKAPPKFPAHTVGNGRIELLKPRSRSYFADQIEAVKRTHGDFILVNTNFTVINSVWTDRRQLEEIEIKAGGLNRDDPASVARWEEHFVFEQANYDMTVALIKDIAQRHPTQPIVLRPHPGEHLARWDGIFTDPPNVRVIREGSHVPWTLASKMLIHTSCTTGFEAFVAGKPIISLVPHETDYARSMLANLVTPLHATRETALQAVEKALAGEDISKSFTADERRAVEDCVWNFADNDSIGRMVSLIQKYRKKPQELLPEHVYHIDREPMLAQKIQITPEQFAERFQLMMNTVQLRRELDLAILGDSLFQITPLK